MHGGAPLTGSNAGDAGTSTCPVIFGADGLVLTGEERSFFADVGPAGYILFARNCKDPAQVKDLIAEMKHLAAHDRVMVMIDQEGGRVQRLRPPNWQERPSAADFGAIYAKDPDLALEAIRLNAQLIALELGELGINVNCAPVADIRWPGAHEVIGDRAYSGNAKEVAIMARAVCEGHLDGGVLPVVKHMPGHGRTQTDSHNSLPIIDIAWHELGSTDFYPFIALSDMPLGMTAHIVLSCVDPERPVSTSQKAIRDVIRGTFGFDGVLFSDDIGMNALEGSAGERAANCLHAGCDLVLHCNGDMAERKSVIAAVNAIPVDHGTRRRVDSAFAMLQQPKGIDIGGSADRINNILCL